MGYVLSKYKKKKVLTLIFCLVIIVTNVMCTLFGDILTDLTYTEVTIQPEIIVKKQNIFGDIGFCGILGYNQIDTSGIKQIYYKNLLIIQNDFLDSIDGKYSVKCNYEGIKDFNYMKFLSKYPEVIKNNYNPPIGYVQLFDEKDKNGVWKLHDTCIYFLNDHFKCDYYLAGRIDLSSADKKLNIKYYPDFIIVRLVLVLYDNKGYKVWSNIYQKKYEYKIKDQLQADISYFYVKKMMNDSTVEITNNLSFINANVR